jgi:hypothetical protein
MKDIIDKVIGELPAALIITVVSWCISRIPQWVARARVFRARRSNAASAKRIDKLNQNLKDVADYVDNPHKLVWEALFAALRCLYFLGTAGMFFLASSLIGLLTPGDRFLVGMLVYSGPIKPDTKKG